MNSPVDRLRVVYELQDQQYRAGMRQMQQASKRTTDQIVQQAHRAERAVSALGRSLKTFLSAAAATIGIRNLARLSDAATQMGNSLRVAGVEGDELTRVYGKLLQSAQRNAAPVSSLVNLYSKLALTQKELGVTGDELIRFTDGVAVALRVAGTDATTASGSLLQLSQALGGGIVRAEEFNSILEGTPTIAQAVARGLKEANGSVAELRKLVVDGKVSSTAFFRAFEAGSDELRRQADTSEITISQAFTQLGNSLVTVVGDFNKATGASSKLAGAISTLGTGIGRFDAKEFVAEIQAITQAFHDAGAAVADWLHELGNAQIFSEMLEKMGVTEGGLVINPEIEQAERKIATLERLAQGLQAQIERDSAFGLDTSAAVANLQAVRAELAAVRAEAAALPRYDAEFSNWTTGTFIDGTGYKPPPGIGAPTEPELVSINDYPPPGKPGKPGRGRKGRGGSAERDRPFFEDIDREIQNIQREITLIGKSTAEVAKARAEWAMLDEAKKRGIAVSAEMEARIEAEARKLGELTQQQQHLQAVSDSVRSSLQNAFDGIFDDPKEALKDLAKQLAMLAVQMQLVRFFPGTFGSGGIIPLLPGRASGGPVMAGQPYMVGERGPEPFVPAVSGRILSVGQAQAALRGGGGGTSIQIIDQRSASAPPVETETTRGPDGREIVRMIVADDLARGRYDKTMGGRYGAKPQRRIR